MVRDRNALCATHIEDEYMATTERAPILLIDDNEATCVLIEAILHGEFICDQASDGADAIEKLTTNRYSAILLDLKMPNMDGFGVLDFLRENFPDVLGRVLVVTAALMPTELKQVEEYKVCGVVRKPFHVEDLLESVKNCVAGSDDRERGGAFFKSSAVLFLLAEMLRSRLG